MPRTIRVEAPCDMNAGYTFLARTSSCEEVAVTVPAGGVRGGEIFFVRRTAGTLVSPISSILSFTNLPDAAANAAAANNNNIFINETTPLVMARPPQHPWKASLWDSCCCRQGGLGPACRALCCPQLLAAQVMVRLRLNWLGVPDYASHNKRRTLGIVAAMVGVFWVVLVVTVVPRLLLFLEEEDDEDVSVEDETEQNQLRSGTTLVGRLCWVILIMFGVYTLYILTKLRHFVRRKYQIAPIKCCCCCRSSIRSSRRSSCSDCCAPEDCCVSLWCSCCVASQLLRQTAEEGGATTTTTAERRCCSPYHSLEGDENSTATEISSRCDDSTSLAIAELA